MRWGLINYARQAVAVKSLAQRHRRPAWEKEMNRSISTIKADLAHSEFGATGRDIVWAVIATGVDGTHPHFKALQEL